MNTTPPLLDDSDNTVIPSDVIPLYGQDSTSDKPSKGKIIYDILSLVLLVVDLLLILTDNILMSSFATKVAEWLSLSHALLVYHHDYHANISAINGFFTLFWVVELSVRWVRAIIKKTYFRWFFFPFVHWYETLSCFPALRALRLLRAGIIIKRLHEIGIKVIPERWLKSAQFYYHVLLEELSDRVILTATGNLKEQLAKSQSKDMVKSVIDRNRTQIENVVLELLRHELSPKLHTAFLSHAGERLSLDVGRAVEKALMDTPELRKYLKLIPIAGSMIESQITHVGKHIGENVTHAINAHLFDQRTLDGLMVEIAKGVANVNTDHPELQGLVQNIINDAIIAFENQVKTQQWKHKEQLQL